jgi:hypothetical protein
VAPEVPEVAERTLTFVIASGQTTRVSLTIARDQKACCLPTFIGIEGLGISTTQALFYDISTLMDEMDSA